MSFLQENNSENLAARITNKGRKKIAQGNFSITYFQVGDSEYDYGFSEFDGDVNLAQKVLMPLDKDSQVKYPYKVSSSTLTGTTYGVPIQASMTTTIRNEVEAAGYVSEYTPYDGGLCNVGTSVICSGFTVDISAINGTSVLSIPSGHSFNVSSYITMFFDPLCGSNDIIAAPATSLVYKIVGVTSNTLSLDRTMPDLSSLPSKPVTIISNDCGSPGVAWTLNNVWSQNPAGLDPSSNTIDEKLSGYTSNIFVSTKEFFGYNTSSGQTSNTGTTITNSFGDVIIVLPEEQHSLSIIHFSKIGDVLTDPDLAYQYDDYIDHTVDGSDYFEIYIPFMYYERTGSTIGARFFMDTTDYYINSSAVDTRNNQMKFRYLLDEIGNKVGKIFVNHKVIVFDDQEIVAILDYKSNRRYTLPVPRTAIVPIDTQCGECGDINNPMLGGTGDTVFMSYLLQYSGDTALNGLHLNHYPKIVGSATVTGDASIKFGDNDFRFLQSTLGLSGATVGYIADTFKVLAQVVTTGTQPDPTAWRVMDFTNQIPGHIFGNLIDPSNLQGSRYIVNHFDYDAAPLYVLPDPDLVDTTTSPEFGDEQPFTGSIKAIRATDIEVMRYLVNLPSGDFEVTQNPSYTPGKDKRITEVALLDSNKDILVIAKTSSPIKRVGSQVLAVKIDI
jgi:hypothetical protein